jgi:H+/Cl- antiporter ClcA
MKTKEIIQNLILAIYGGFLGAVVSYHINNPFGKEVWLNVIWMGAVVFLLIFLLNYKFRKK